jgi:hypothetical protein
MAFLTTYTEIKKAVIVDHSPDGYGHSALAIIAVG